jgi:hypothetical protein
LHQRLVTVMRERLRYVGEDPGRPSELRFVMSVEPTALVLRAVTIYRRYAGVMDLVVDVESMPGGGSRACARREAQAKRNPVAKLFAAGVAGMLVWNFVEIIRATGSVVTGVLFTLPLALFAVVMFSFLPVMLDRRAVDAQMAQAEQVVAAVFRDAGQHLGAIT